jgi:hypothetical protein
VPPVPGQPPCPPGYCAKAAAEIIATAASNTVSADFVPFKLHLAVASVLPVRRAVDVGRGVFCNVVLHA